jgi:intron-binding protein aquarius
VHQCLERYLWPGWRVGSSKQHALLILLLVNEKLRERLDAWVCFSDNAERFTTFFTSVVTLRAEKDGAAQLSLSERKTLLVFLINAFASLESEAVRSVALPLVSLPLWHALSPGRLQLELASNPQLDKHWKHLLKREAMATRGPQRAAAEVLPGLLDGFVSTLRATVSTSGELNAGNVAYCEVRACC